MDKSNEDMKFVCKCPKCGRDIIVKEEIPDPKFAMVFCRFCKLNSPSEFDRLATIYLKRVANMKKQVQQKKDQKIQQTITIKNKVDECLYCKTPLSKNYGIDLNKKIIDFLTPIYTKVKKFSRTSHVRSEDRRISPNEVQFKMTHTKYKISRQTYPYNDLEGNVCQNCANLYFDQIRKSGLKIKKKMQVSPYEGFIYSTPLIFSITVLLAILFDDVAFLFVMVGGFAVMLSSWLLGYWGFLPKRRLKGLETVVNSSILKMNQLKANWTKKITRI